MVDLKNKAIEINSNMGCIEIYDKSNKLEELSG